MKKLIWCIGAVLEISSVFSTFLIISTISLIALAPISYSKQPNQSTPIGDGSNNSCEEVFGNPDSEAETVNVQGQGLTYEAARTAAIESCQAELALVIARFKAETHTRQLKCQPTDPTDPLFAKCTFDSETTIRPCGDSLPVCGRCRNYPPEEQGPGKKARKCWNWTDHEDCEDIGETCEEDGSWPGNDLPTCDEYGHVIKWESCTGSGHNGSFQEGEEPPR